MAGAVPLLTAWPSAAFGCRWTVTFAGSWERSRVGSSGLPWPAGFVRGSRALVLLRILYLCQLGQKSQLEGGVEAHGARGRELQLQERK